MKVIIDDRYGYEFPIPEDAHWLSVAYTALERDLSGVSPSVELYNLTYAKHKDILENMNCLGMITRTINGIITEMYLFAEPGTYYLVKHNEPQKLS